MIIEKYGMEIKDVSNSHFKRLRNVPYFFNYYRHISSDTVCVKFRVSSVFQNFLLQIMSGMRVVGKDS